MGKWFKSKKERREERLLLRLNEFNAQTQNINKPALGDTVSFKHSGQTGDIIYSIPAMLGLANGRKIDFYIQLDVKIDLPNLPYGAKMFSIQAFEMLLPLLKIQPYFNKIEIYAGQTIDYDLDLFRNLPINYNTGCLQRYWFHLFNTNYDLSQSWINLIPVEPALAQSIVVNRSHRYRNSTINYSFLNEYKEVNFIGTNDEYSDFSKFVPKANHLKITDFLQMASYIRSCKIFIGNQSFPFALAEAMKCTRILEICPETPHVIPHGSDGYDFYFQSYLEDLVATLVK